MQKERVMEIAFQIIAYAGEASDYFNRAVTSAINLNFEQSERDLSDGRQSIKEAHKAQMDLIVAETNGEDIPYCLTMTHAQDHLMNAILTETMAKHLIAIVKLKQK